MDITSQISLITATIEFILATWVYTKFQKTNVTVFFFFLLILMGTYQFSEYLVCSNNYMFWGRLSFIACTLFPPLILYYSVRITTKKNYWWIFVPALIFISFAVFTKGFVLEGYCFDGLILLRNKILYNYNQTWLTMLYNEHFIIMVALTVIVCHRGVKNTNIIQKKYIYRIISASTFLLILLPTIHIVFVPTFSIMYASLLNRYVTFFALSAIFCVYLEKQALEIENEEIKNPE